MIQSFIWHYFYFIFFFHILPYNLKIDFDTHNCIYLLWHTRVQSNICLETKQKLKFIYKDCCTQECPVMIQNSTETLLLLDQPSSSLLNEMSQESSPVRSSSSSNSNVTTPTKSTRTEFMDYAKRRLSSGTFKSDLMPYFSLFKSPRKGRREST